MSKNCRTFALAFGNQVAPMSPCAIKATDASALPTAIYGYVGDPKKRLNACNL